jgi:hypothetical protein
MKESKTKTRPGRRAQATLTLRQSIDKQDTFQHRYSSALPHAQAPQNSFVLFI